MAKVIAQLGIADIVNAKAIVNATGLVGERVVRGEVELGFQQVSELLAVKGIDLIGELPAAVQLNSLFAAGIGALSVRLGTTPQRSRGLLYASSAAALVIGGVWLVGQ